MKMIAEPGWRDGKIPIELCMLPFERQELEERYGLSFFTYTEDGLGSFCVCYVEISAQLYLLVSPPESTGLTLGGLEEFEYEKILVFISCQSADPAALPGLLLDDLNLKDTELLWCGMDAAAANWVLTRLDDNNNEIEMSRFLLKDCAEMAQAVYEKKGHKQSYYVKQIE